MYVYPKHAGTREQPQPLDLWRSLLTSNRPIQRFTSGILSLCLFDSQRTVQPQQLDLKILGKRLHEEREKQSLKVRD